MSLDPLTQFDSGRRIPWTDNPNYVRCDYAWWIKNTGQDSLCWFGTNPKPELTELGGTWSLNMDSAWALVPDASGITIGIVGDTVKSDHEDLSGIVIAQTGAMGMSNHGTMIAGLAASKSNSVGICGIAPGASIVNYCVSDYTPKTIADGINWCLDEIDPRPKVIVVPWGTPIEDMALRRACYRAGLKGTVIVCSVSESAQDITSTPDYPSSYGLRNVLPTACCGRDGALYASAWGNGVVASPGRNVISCSGWSGPIAPQYCYGTGTSYAAGVMAGTVALLAKARPSKGCYAYVEAIRNSADRTTDDKCKRLRVREAILAIQS